jgi:hypothetical protein
VGVWGRVTDIRISLNDLSHTFPDDLDFLFVGPGGRNLAFWSDAGSGNDIVNGDFTIRDSGASLLPDTTAIASGTYKPTDYTFGSHWRTTGAYHRASPSTIPQR